MLQLRAGACCKTKDRVSLRGRIWIDGEGQVLLGERWQIDVRGVGGEQEAVEHDVVLEGWTVPKRRWWALMS